MSRRFAAGTAVGAALIVSLAACNIGGGNSASGDPKNVKLTAAQAIARTSQKAGTVNSFKATLAENGSFSGQATDIQGTMRVQVKPQLLTSLNLTKMQVAGKSVAGMQEITTADAIYLKIPALAQSAGKPWIKLSLSQLGQQSGIDLKGLMSQSQGIDPAANVKMLTASKDAHVVGTETVDGVRTTHYRGTYTVSDGLARLDSDQRQKMQQLMSQQGLSTLNFDLWVDGQNLPRKVMMKTPAGSKTQLNITETISDYNQKVTVKAPPASEVSTENPKLPTGISG